MAGGILALDLASTTGWAAERTPLPPILGTQRFWRQDRYSYGSFGVEYLQWLDELLHRFEPERVIFEAPLLPTRQGSEHTAMIAFGLAFATEICCAQWRVPVFQVHQQTYSKYFAGSGKRDQHTKARVITACEARGWTPEDDNAADAGAILAWAIAAYHPNDDARNRAVGNIRRLV